MEHVSHLPAASASSAGKAAGPCQYLTFSLEGQIFGIGILHVKEIIEYGSLTEIPMMPPSIRGVINLRGAVVPVIDLAARFGGEPTGVGRRTCIIIIEQPEEDGCRDMGVVVDAVNEVIDIPLSDMTPPPGFGARVRTDFIDGMGRVGGRFIIILNVPRVLSVEEMALLDGLGQGALPEGGRS
ncbi:chemotaxis protein CheW [Zoogloea sp.]|uniref:chemotaxis protein CheW n=1 Tax=Zoogloea sp. TaxID=49181 RepID=UPI0026000226|nr:chemotaxis protein CheW [Zoogloea sp.]MCK6393647.1 chemotaxis protein CheW [Zoogloea sp.]